VFKKEVYEAWDKTVDSVFRKALSNGQWITRRMAGEN
jgi:hypothetical protein